MYIGTTYPTGTSYTPAAAKGANHSSLSAYELEQRKLGREVMGRLDTFEFIMANAGSSKAGNATLINFEGHGSSKPTTFSYTAAEAKRASDNIPKQVYAMLMEYKANAEEGSLRMAAINEWLAKLSSK